MDKSPKNPAQSSAHQTLSRFFWHAAPQVLPTKVAGSDTSCFVGKIHADRLLQRLSVLFRLAHCWQGSMRAISSASAQSLRRVFLPELSPARLVTGAWCCWRLEMSSEQQRAAQPSRKAQQGGAGSCTTPLAPIARERRAG